MGRLANQNILQSIHDGDDAVPLHNVLIRGWGTVVGGGEDGYPGDAVDERLR